MLHNNHKISIAIVDDHPIVIEGFRSLLESSPLYEIAGCFTTGAGCMGFLQQHKADIVLLDITLPDGNGVHFCAVINEFYPDTMVVALSNLNERSIISQLFKNGAKGYLLKNISAKELLDALNTVWEGNIAMSPEVKEIMQQPDLNTLQTIPELTKREKQILQLLAEGRKSAAIAEELFISPLTVKTHRATLLHKFQVSNIVTLVNRAKETGLI
ncbi:response regulator [Chitinophaga pinensis]|uniref:Two component transcriptional regulator, LuxR family n=1 Tax=Chitinophaga pinensis (strain ATCC 43595 / DSM 2588 / LMG 13176 / NBRC 15968 / NCIMB 11800 / UQM 2034) TaxID=485918 RepID=A0A979G6W2_CHIPD|nr:response regulator transcription factor [Chitinophaga pinensis]ACU61727.1 two component transcriptional regulator, LuxR family [Chitinophaga pinensis DSM 2588]